MKYIIFAIETHAEEFLFIIQYNKGEERIILGELIKLNNLCYIKEFNFDFFEIIEDPNYVLNKEGIYIYRYNTFSDVLNRLNLKLLPEEIKELKIKNKQIFNIMTKKSKSDILRIMMEGYDNSEIFRSMFEEKKKK